MTPMLATSLGFVVAAMIIFWALVMFVQRINRLRKASKAIRASRHSNWVTLKPASMRVETFSRDLLPEERTDDDTHNHSKQNGRYSHLN